MSYSRWGKSGLLLPEVSLGLWHNFGHVDDFNTAQQILHEAFNHGITHFDLLGTLEKLNFTTLELQQIEDILK